MHETKRMTLFPRRRHRSRQLYAIDGGHQAKIENQILITSCAFQQALQSMQSSIIHFFFSCA